MGVINHIWQLVNLNYQNMEVAKDLLRLERFMTLEIMDPVGVGFPMLVQKCPVLLALEI